MSLLVLIWFSPLQITEGLAHNSFLPRITWQVIKGKIYIGLRLTNRRGIFSLIVVLTGWRPGQFSFKDFPMHIGITTIGSSSQQSSPSLHAQRLYVFYIVPQPPNTGDSSDEEDGLLEDKLL